VITLTVGVASNAPASVTNTVTVSGGGDANLSNNAAADPTTNNPRVVSVTSLSPASALAGASAFTLTVNGSGFISGDDVRWGGFGPADDLHQFRTTAGGDLGIRCSQRGVDTRYGL
jgi:hypothetical protein